MSSSPTTTTTTTTTTTIPIPLHNQHQSPSNHQLLPLSLIQKLPKAELHCHLDGSVRVSTIIELAQEQGVTLPTTDLDDLTRLCTVDDAQCESLEQYLQDFSISLSVMQTKSAISRIMYEVCEDAYNDGVRYIEVRFSPILHVQNGLSLAMVMEAVCEGQILAELKLRGMIARIIVCGMRQMSSEVSLSLAEIAWRYKSRGVVGFDLAGPEYGFSSKLHREAFELIRRKLINCTLHSGEASDWRSVHDSIRFCGAQRIGHGVRMAQSEELVQFVVNKRIAVEVCITSNLQTKSIDRYMDHPIRQYYDRGMVVVPCTDNVTVSGTTLSKEYHKIQHLFGFSVRDMVRMIDYGFRSSFLDHALRMRVRLEAMIQTAQILIDAGIDVTSISSVRSHLMIGLKFNPLPDHLKNMIVQQHRMKRLEVVAQSSSSSSNNNNNKVTKNGGGDHGSGSNNSNGSNESAVAKRAPHLRPSHVRTISYSSLPSLDANGNNGNGNNGNNNGTASPSSSTDHDGRSPIVLGSSGDPYEDEFIDVPLDRINSDGNESLKSLYEDRIDEWRSLIQQLPKCDNNTTLNGSVSIDTLWSILQQEKHSEFVRRQFELLYVEDIDEEFPTRDHLAQFIQLKHPSERHTRRTIIRSIQTMAILLQTTEHLEMALADIYEHAVRDNVRYMELYVRPSLHVKRGLSLRQVIDTVLDKRDELENSAQYANKIRCNIVLTVDNMEDGIEQMRQVATLIVEYKSKVVGFAYAGLNADKDTMSREEIQVFNLLKKHQINVSITSGFKEARSVVTAISDCGATRLSGCFAIHTERQIMDYMARNRIPVEFGVNDTLSHFVGGDGDSTCIGNSCVKKNKEDIVGLYLEMGIMITPCSFDMTLYNKTRSNMLFELCCDCKLDLNQLLLLMYHSYRSSFADYWYRVGLQEKTYIESLKLLKMNKFIYSGRKLFVPKDNNNL